MSLAMTKAEREAFLAATHVGLISVARSDRAPLAVPIWYRYAPGGDIVFITGRSSRKAALLQRSRRASFCVQTETPPYQYVSVEGPVVFAGAPDFERDAREMAVRYLGPQVAEMYLAATAEDRADAVLVRLTPQRWLSADYSKFGA